jgi:hypothetical protein
MRMGEGRPEKIGDYRLLHRRWKYLFRCIECINKNTRVMNEIDRAITAENSEGTLLFCEGCEKEIKGKEI